MSGGTRRRSRAPSLARPPRRRSGITRNAGATTATRSPSRTRGGRMGEAMSSVREIIERLVEQQNSVGGLAALAGSAMIEYVFPPFPGDFVTVLGAVLVTGYGWSFPLVLGAVMLGSVAGTLI